MSHRYTREEKGKGKEEKSRAERRRPIQIPQSDNSALIEENKLTLIGRVTNPTIQKTQWVVEWLLQYWNVDGELTGREVLIDGLKNLEMLLPLQLPSGEVISVNLEYEKLEKHCFLCYSLCHEKENCPQYKDDTGERSPQGISQKNTLRKLEEHRRIHDNKRSISLSSRDRVSDPREQRSSQRSVYSRLQEPVRGRTYQTELSRPHIARERDRRRYGENMEERTRSFDRERSSHQSYPTQRNQSPSKRVWRERSPGNRSKEHRRPISSGHNTQSSRTPPSRPAREPMNLPAAPDQEEVISGSRYRVPTLERREEELIQGAERISALERLEEPPLHQERISALERIEEVPNQTPDRISALERIEDPMEVEPRPSGLSSSLLARLQDVEITYEAEENQSPQVGVGGERRIGSTSSPQTHQESPRIPASLRLGSSSGSRKRSNTQATAPAKKATRAKQPPKKKPPGRITGATNTRAIRSPIQGIRLSKQLTAKAKPAARKKLCVDKNGQ
ncbi:hypothetical protein IGI04_029947, partial [Brassica rapa subsp. trilocularis]